MLDRYTTPRMRAIWTLQASFDRWRQVELAVLDARVLLGEAPASAARAARGAVAPNVVQVREAELRTKHDVTAFLEVWTGVMSDEAGSWVHRGLTSSDIVDTGLALQLVTATDVVLERADDLVRALAGHALVHRHTERVGRTHGIHAAPDTWGHRVADIALAADRARLRLARVREQVAVAKLSGPVGTYSHISVEVERRAAELLGLAPVDVATQVVMRDRISEWMCSLALLASVCECLALEVRHGQRSEVGELAEGFARGQVGSSAMPHKRNPITAEKICGLARVVRSYVVPVMEGISLWHERDISHSSVERICLPDSSMLVEHILVSSTALIRELAVNTSRMTTILACARPQVDSDSAVVALMAAGMRREAAHELVLEAVAADPSIEDFVERVRGLAEAQGVSVDERWSILDRGDTATSTRLDHVFEQVARLVSD